MAFNWVGGDKKSVALLSCALNRKTIGHITEVILQLREMSFGEISGKEIF